MGVVGWFNESLPRFLAQHANNVSLVHIDSDLYSSASTVLTLLGPRLSPGAVLVFDELINYIGYELHELRALRELQLRTLRSLRVIGTPALVVLREHEKMRRAFASRGGEMANVPPY